MAIINRFYEYQTDDDGRIVCFQTTGQLAGGLRTSVRAPRHIRVLSGQTLYVEKLALCSPDKHPGDGRSILCPAALSALPLVLPAAVQFCRSAEVCSRCI